MKKSMGILTVAAVMLFAQTAAYAAEQTTKEREGAGKISGQETQKQSGQEMQKQSGQEMQKPSGPETQRQSGQEMQRPSGQSEQAGNFSEEMQRQTKQFWQSGQQAQSQCQRPGQSQQAASQQPATQPSQAGQPSASQQQPGQQPGQAGREQGQQATQDQGKPTQGQSAAGPGSAQTVKGQFVRVEGDFYIIKDQSGKEVCIPSSYGTFIDQTFVPGDNIVARLGSDGSAMVIGRADTQTASAGTQDQGMTAASGMTGTQQAAPGQGMTPGPTEQTPKGSEKDLAASQQTPTIVKGELLKIQGEFYTVKEQSGNEVRLHVNKETKLEGTFNVGDRIEAERTSSDHAVAIKKAQDGGKGSGGSSRPQ